MSFRLQVSGSKFKNRALAINDEARRLKSKLKHAGSKLALACFHLSASLML